MANMSYCRFENTANAARERMISTMIRMLEELGADINTYYMDGRGDCSPITTIQPWRLP